MKKTDRRSFLKASATGSAVGAWAALGGRISLAAEAEKRRIKIAGYDYHRVRAIMDGQVGIDGTDVSFHYEDIYAVNDYAFGLEPKYAVSELGLIPYVSKYINEDFRAYTLIPEDHFAVGDPGV
jgi:hypothetical protein